MNKFKAVLFDLDGTLLNSIPVILKATKEVFTVMGIKNDVSDMQKMIGVPLEVQAKMFAKDRDAEFIDTYRAYYRKYTDQDMSLYPQTLEMLDVLKSGGFVTALVTSKAAKSAARAVEKTGMGGIFDIIVSADDVTRPKPDPEPLLKALAMLSLKPEEALYVGDSLFDIDAAQKAGIAVAAVSWGARSREDLLLQHPDGVFDTWNEFLSWLGAPVSVLQN